MEKKGCIFLVDFAHTDSLPVTESSCTSNAQDTQLSRRLGYDFLFHKPCLHCHKGYNEGKQQQSKLLCLGIDLYTN